MGQVFGRGKGEGFCRVFIVTMVDCASRRVSDIVSDRIGAVGRSGNVDRG